MSVSQTYKFLFLSLTVLLQFYTSAQRPTFLPITTHDGLSQNSVTSITQDSFGFIWIATQDGLNRYDGTNFTKYDAYFYDITAASYSWIGKLYTDSHNRVWHITSDDKVSYYQEGVDTIKTITQLEKASVIIQKSDHEYWLGSYTKGLHLLSLEEGDVRLENVIPNISVYNILSEDNHIFLSTEQGVLDYNVQSKESINLTPDLSSYQISDVIRSIDGELLISTFNQGLYQLKRDKSLNLYENLPANTRIQDLHQDSKGTIWIATYDDGLYVIKNEKLHHYQHTPPEKDDINYNDILTIYEDTKGNIWIGTDGGGLSISRADQKPINSLTNSDTPIGMAVDVARSISTDQNGNIWIGTSGKGLTMQSKDGSNTEHYSTTQVTPYYMPIDRIMSLYHNNNDQLWIGTQEGGLITISSKNKEAKRVAIELSNYTIWDIKPKDPENIWLCTRSNGLILYNTSRDTWKRYSPDNPASLRVMINGKKGSCFIGTDEGQLLKFNEEEGSFEYIDLSIETGGIKSLLLHNQELWIGTQREGIIIYNIETHTSKIINESHGLPNKVIYALLIQKDKYIWASTNRGICQIDISAVQEEKENVVYQKLDFQNGLANNEFNTGASHMDPSGNMYFGGIKGINWFNPEDILKNRKPIDLLYLEITTNKNNKKTTSPIYHATPIELDYKSRNFQIKYTDLEYGNPENINFRYRLEGYDEDWINNEKNRLISYSNVPPGSYTLQLSASNEDNFWNLKSKELIINIAPALWETWWFGALTIICGILLGWFLLDLRIRNIKRTSQLQQDLAQSESKALKAQMNPHFLFNSLNAIDNYILNNDPAKASDYLSKFSKLIRKILDNSDLPSITLQEEIDILKLYIKMEQMRFSDRFDVNIKLGPHIQPGGLVIPPLIIQPFVENAIWHGLIHLDKKGELTIRFSLDEDSLICEIRDNGIGREKALENKSKSATKRKSHGMKIAMERLRLFNENTIDEQLVVVTDILSNDQNPLGTKVALRFPVKKVEQYQNH